MPASPFGFSLETARHAKNALNQERPCRFHVRKGDIRSGLKLRAILYVPLIERDTRYMVRHSLNLRELVALTGLLRQHALSLRSAHADHKRVPIVLEVASSRTPRLTDMPHNR